METSSTLESPAVFRQARGRNLQVVSERTAQEPTPEAREAALVTKEVELKAALATVSAAFSILGSRALVILASLGSAAGFGWAIYASSGIALLGASVYTCLVFLPALWMDRRTPS